MWGIIALKKLSRIIIAGAVDESVVQRLGLESAPSLYRALAMAENTLGKDFSLTYLAMPPIFCTKVSD